MLRRETLRRRFFHLPLWLIAFVLAPCVMLGAISAGYEILASESHPLVGLIWSSTVDPTVGAGVAAPQWQLLIRTDNNTLYFKSGPSNTAWTVLGGGGGGGGTVTSITCGTSLACSPSSPITTAGTISVAATAVTPATYTNATVTVNQEGQVTAASNGTAPATGTGTTGKLPIWSNGPAGILSDSSEQESFGVFLVGTSGLGINEGSGFITLPPQSAALPTPASGANFGASLIANATSVPSFTNENGTGNFVQSELGHRNWWALVPLASSSATLLSLGTVDTATGTRTARTPASTSLGTSVKRLGYVSSGSVAGTRSGLAWIWRGNAAGLGGFRITFRFEISDASIVTGRTFVGLEASTGAPTDVEPASLTNIVGMCNGSADSNFAICAAGAVAQSETTLGASFPCNTTSTDVYEFVLAAAPDASVINWKAVHLNTGVAATGQVSVGAQLPSNTTFLTPQMWRSSDGQGVTAAGIDVVGQYGETPD